MYADFSSDRVNAFLSDLTAQPAAGDVERMAESFSDEMMLAHMELSRLKASRLSGQRFIPRDELLAQPVRLHPSDLH